MNQTFTMSRSYRRQGILFLVVFSIAALAGAYPLVHSDWQHSGYFSRHDEISMCLLCLAVCGSMALMSILLLTYYCRVRLSISDTAVEVRYLLQPRRFLVTDITSADWYASPSRVIRIKGSNQKTTIDLRNFSEPDRLAIVRALRQVLPPDCQTNWSDFCHAVALPLRDRISPRDRLAAQTGESSGWFIVKRSRYDRQAIVLMPVTLAIAALLWWRMHWPLAMLLPAAAALWWQVCRWATPKQGRRQPHLIRSPEGRFALIILGWFFAACAMIPIAHRAGLSVDAAMWVGVVLMVLMVPVMLVFTWRMEKGQKRERELGSTTAEAVWDRGEPAAAT